MNCLTRLGRYGHDGVMADTDTPQLLPIGEAAHILGVSASTLRRWEREGRIYAYRTLGGQRRYRRDHIDRLAKRRASLPDA